MTAVATQTREAAQPFSAEQTKEIIDRYNRDGYVHVPGVLTPGEVAAIKEAADRAFADPKAVANHNVSSPNDLAIVRLFEFDPLFVRLLTREPVISLMEALLGPQCHIIANNLVRNKPGVAIDSFHVDDVLWLPLPPEIPRFDARMTMPNYIVNAHFPLTDVPSDEYGPTQVVPGSHYSGRNHNDPKNPTWEGRGPVSMLARAGDMYLQHPQAWHRGAPNTSDRVRYLYQQAWGMRFISQRFHPFLNYRMPEHVLEGADERTLRVLGKHPRGAYG